MAGRIPSAFIDDLLQRVDIVEVIDKHVPLKKTGREYTACCPFHNEKTPSFTVSQTKQFYHCFGCGQHGSAIGFLMAYEHLDFIDAVEELARMIGVEVPYETKVAPEVRQSQKQEQATLFELMARCDRFYRQQLRQHPQATVAVDYLKSRGLTGEIAARFNIGFAPPGWDGLTTAMGKENEAALFTLGMLIKKDGGGVYDRFRNRIMFPIRDSRGRVMGFGGRVLNKEESPKYLNSPETPLFHKGQELYGLYEARQALRHIPRLLVVEGYMDVVALAQFDIAYAVATLGTATTPEHLQRLFRLTEEVVFCFDGDRAGRDAAWRALEQTLPVVQEGRTIRFMFLPEGDDPDTLVRKVGKEAFETLVTQAQPLSEYFFSALQKQADLSHQEGRAQLVELAGPLLVRMPKGNLRSMLVNQLGQLARMDLATMFIRMEQETSAPVQAQKKSIANTSQRAAPSLVRKAIEILLYAPEQAAHVTNRERFTGLDIPGIELLSDLLETLEKNPTLNTAAILERWRDTDEGKQLAKLASWQPPFDNPDSLKQELLGALSRLVAQHREARTEHLLAKANLGALSPDEKTELKQLLLPEQATSGPV